MQVFEGEVCNLEEEFLDDDDAPIDPGSSVPFVVLKDVDKNIVSQSYATAVPLHPGRWQVALPIPLMNLAEDTDFIAFWKMETPEGIYRARSRITVQAQGNSIPDDLIVLCERDTRIELTLPVTYRPPVPDKPADIRKGIPAKKGKKGDSLVFSLYYNNAAVYEDWSVSDSAFRTEKVGKFTLVSMPAVTGRARMSPLVMTASYRPKGSIQTQTFTYKVWAVTPQIMLAAREVEDFINKAKIANVIPELEYTQANLLEYLARGLMMFNSLQPNITNFDGTNMQGPLLNSWLICSCYYALGAQLQAEGALAFDFGGQTVSLNVDRTPAIESALGRIENEVENTVKPFKKLLGRTGILSGDGSAGGQFMDTSRALGVLGLSNTPLTRFPNYHRGSWMRSFF